jgi:glycerol-3-phosphate dehydrogenase
MKRPDLAQLQPKYDLVVIGGGITGAAVLSEAARSGLKALLLEQNDFASGTSAGSSKLVHGGLRYLRSGQWRLTRDSVSERQRLLRTMPDLVEPLPFMMPIYQGQRPGKTAMKVGLWLYDRMAGARTSRWIEADEALRLEEGIREQGLLGAMLYEDARTNDTRLVLTLIVQAWAAGAMARNYTRVDSLLRADGRVRGVALRAADGATREIEAGVVVDATGAQAGSLSPGGKAPKLRKLRGSHFFFERQLLPLKQAVSWMHPRDRRPVFAYPWENVTLVGTTDIDHDGPADQPPRMSRAEADYLIEGLVHQFPNAGLKAGDALCSYSAVRSVVSRGKARASDESRESALWSEPGLVGVTGGKLTTFRLTAQQVLRAVARLDATLAHAASEATVSTKLSSVMRTQTRSVEEVSIAGTRYSVARVRFAARNELAVHLDDIMLRRTRLGLVLPRGGRDLLPQLAPVCKQELKWSDERWREEEQRYLQLWDRDHAPAPPG